MKELNKINKKTKGESKETLLVKRPMADAVPE